MAWELHVRGGKIRLCRGFPAGFNSKRQFAAMKKFVEHRELLFSTLSEITSLIIAGNDKRIIFQKLLDCSLRVLDAERVHLFELDQGRILKEEYEAATDLAASLGMDTGWIQDPVESPEHYRPDFRQAAPFEPNERDLGSSKVT